MYVSVDGDDIGRMLTQKIYSGSEDEVRNFSALVTNTFAQFSDWVSSNKGKVLFCAGDSILFLLDDDLVEDALNQLKSSAFTMSIGIGDTLREAHWALNVAKSLGKARSVYFSQIRSEIFGIPSPERAT